MKLKNLFIIALLSIISIGCAQKQSIMKPYVIEVTSFKYKASVDPTTFWAEDVKVDNIFTSKQPGYINRESGYSKGNNEVIVVVRWKSQDAADASMKKFMGDDSVKNYANMIDAPSMKMARYDVK